MAELRPVRLGRPLCELADLFASLPHLGREEAEAFDRDVEEARELAERAPVHDPWPDAD